MAGCQPVPPRTDYGEIIQRNGGYKILKTKGNEKPKTESSCATRAQYTAEITDDPDPPQNASFKCDWLLLSVRQGTNLVYTHTFESSYNEASASLIVDATNRWLLLRYGVGRGTSVRDEYLTVYEMLDYLVETVRVPISGYCGDGVKWEYKWKAHTTVDGLVIDLRLQLDTVPTGMIPVGVPSDKHRQIIIKRNPNTGIKHTR